MEDELEVAPDEDDIFIVDETLSPVEAIVKYSHSSIPAQRHAFIRVCCFQSWLAKELRRYAPAMVHERSVEAFVKVYISRRVCLCRAWVLLRFKARAQQMSTS